MLNDGRLGRGIFGKIFLKNLTNTKVDHDDNEFFKKIDKLHSEGNYHDCLVLLDDFIENSIFHVTAKIYKIIILKDLEKYTEAIKLATECLSAHGHKQVFWKLRGDCYQEINEHELALQDYKVALNLDPYCIGSLCNIALSFFLLKDLENAHIFIDRVIELEKKSEFPMIRKAKFYEHQIYPEKALEQYKRVLELFPESTLAREKIAELSIS